MLEILGMASFLLVFAAIWAVGYFVFWRAYGDDARALARLRDIASDAAPEKAPADALDMLVLCIEGGLSMNAALQRITGELVHVHPALGEELTLVVQTVNLGLSVGEAVKQLGDRCGLEEVRDLASLLLQSERFGAGVAKTLRTHADSSRTDRQQRAEELAQKASVKILFPMLLFIFPAIFIVLLGPA